MKSRRVQLFLTADRNHAKLSAVAHGEAGESIALGFGGIGGAEDRHWIHFIFSYDENINDPVGAGTLLKLREASTRRGEGGCWH